MKKYALAQDDFSYAIDHRKVIDISLGKYFFYRGLARSENKEYFAAGKDFEYAVKLNPSDPEIYFEESQLKFLTMTDKHDAIIDLDRAIQLNPDEARYYKRRAEYKAYQSKYNYSSQTILASAIRDMTFAISLDTTNYEYYHFRSELNKNAGEPMLAVEDYTKMIQLNPEKYDAYSERGIIRMQFDDYRGAIMDFTSAIQKYPDEEKNYRYRALCRYNSSDYQGAYSDYSSAILKLTEKLKIVSDKQIIRRILADTYVKRGVSATSMGNGFDACIDFKTAYRLGSSKGLNYLRKYCGF
jgi:tetratricopeptide (TPR) repeat protein